MDLFHVALLVSSGQSYLPSGISALEIGQVREENCAEDSRMWRFFTASGLLDDHDFPTYGLSLISLHKHTHSYNMINKYQSHYEVNVIHSVNQLCLILFPNRDA